MLQSKLFYKTLKKAPKDTKALSHVLLVRAGFIDQVAAGLFTFLPLGFRVLKKIEDIIRQEMINIDGQEVLMPVLTPKENWETTGRWKTFKELFKLRGQNKKEYVLNPTHEEVISPLAKKFVFSYKNLPFYLFQIQTKFRNELRVKSGLLRTREFLMKDLYSFHKDEIDLDRYYERVGRAYDKIFKRCGIFAYKTLASGGSFSKYSHEYQAITESGEDIIYACEKCSLGINKEIKKEFKKCPKCGSDNFKQEKSVEVGNIFKLGTKYSIPFELKFKDKQGKEKPVIMGCYGIGLPRVMGAVVENNNDKNGIIWPEEVAPFSAHLIRVGNDKRIINASDKLYKNLKKRGLDLLYDDRREKTPGEKFSEADLLGIPLRIVISERTLEKSSVELKERGKKKAELVKIIRLSQFLNSKIKKQKSK